MPGAVTPVAGWYGKIPALGDFASRRLPAEFVTAWDAWLQKSLAASRSALGERWQGLYLNSPVWRFLLWPGVSGSTGWTGIMMPSIDKVGRHFPLTIAVALAPRPEMILLLSTAKNWFAAIEQIALSSLSTDFSVDQLEAALAAAPFVPDSPSPDPWRAAAGDLAAWWMAPGQGPVALSLPDPDALNGLLSACGLKLLSACGTGKSLWWTEDEGPGACQLQGFLGLPTGPHFANLLAGVAAGQKSM